MKPLSELDSRLSNINMKLKEAPNVCIIGFHGMKSIPNLVAYLTIPTKVKVSETRIRIPLQVKVSVLQSINPKESLSS